MKKEYVKPTATEYKIHMTAHLLDGASTSTDFGGGGSTDPEEEGVGARDQNQPSTPTSGVWQEW